MSGTNLIYTNSQNICHMSLETLKKIATKQTTCWMSCNLTAATVTTTYSVKKGKQNWDLLHTPCQAEKEASST